MMMKIFILVFFVGLLSACHQSSSVDQSKTQEFQAIPFSEQTLAQYSWQLIEATDANGQRIDELFMPSEPDKPITLRFADKTLYIDHLFCNVNSIGIYFQGNRLYDEQPIVTTMIGCPDDITLRESTMVQDILVNDPQLYLLSRQSQVQLIMETSKKDRLIFNGIQTNK